MRPLPPYADIRGPPIDSDEALVESVAELLDVASQ